MALVTELPQQPSPWLDLLLWATTAAAVLWLVIGAAWRWRREATNLTVVERTSGGPRPRFTTVDHGSRAEALGRANDAREALDRRDAEERRGGPSPPASKVRIASRSARLLALFMSLFSLCTLVAGAIWQVTWLGVMWEKWSAGDRILAAIQTHPLASLACALVITSHLVTFVRERSWNTA